MSSDYAEDLRIGRRARAREHPQQGLSPPDRHPTLSVAF